MSCSRLRLQIFNSPSSIFSLTDNSTKALMSADVTKGDSCMCVKPWRLCATEPSSTQVTKILTLIGPVATNCLKIFNNGRETALLHSSSPSKIIYKSFSNATLEKNTLVKAISDGDRVPAAYTWKSCDSIGSGIWRLRNSCSRRLPKIPSNSRLL